MEARSLIAILSLVVAGLYAFYRFMAGRKPTSERPPDPSPPYLVSPPEGTTLRQITLALIAGGGLLTSMAFYAGLSRPSGLQSWAFALTLLGSLVLLSGLLFMLRDTSPSWFGRPLARLATSLRVSPLQVILLLLAPGFAGVARLAAGDNALAWNATLSVVAWLLAIALVVAGSAVREGNRPAGDRWDWLFTLVIFAIALGLRAYQTARFPNTFSGDEGSAGLFAVELLTGKATNLFALGWFSFPSFYFAVQSAAIALLGQTVEAVRLTSAVAGALTVVALYWLARSMFDRTTAILAALYLAAFHYHIHMSRIALNNIWDGLFATLAIWGLWAGWQSGRRTAFILAGLAVGLGQYFYVSVRAIPILFLVWAGAAFLIDRPRFRQRFSGLALAAFIALVVYLPLGLYFVEHPDNFQAPLNRVSIFDGWFQGEVARGERTVAEIMLAQVAKGALGFTHEPLRLLYNPGSPLLLAGAAALFILGIMWGLLNFDLRILLLVLPLLAAVASNAVSMESPASQRYVMVAPIVALFVALPPARAAAWLRGRSPRIRPAVAAAALALIILVAAVDLDYYFNRVYDTYVLGDLNTKVATEIGYYLRDKEPAGQLVYFFGMPRMGYSSLSTIPFLAPDKRGQDVVDALTGPPELQLDGPTLFIFLPERSGELEWVRQRYPGGAIHPSSDAQGNLLFVVYER